MKEHAYTNKKLIIFDLDGTLTESKQPITPEIGVALKILLDKKRVAITSGAGLQQISDQLVSHLPDDAHLENLFLLPTNAGAYYTYKEGVLVEAHNYSFTSQEKKQIREALTQALQEVGLSDEEEELYGERIEDRGAQITFSGLGQNAPIDKKEKWDPDHKKRARIVEKLSYKLPDLEIKIGGTTSIDITKKGINKGHGVLELSLHTEIPTSQMIYVGDALFEGGNDASVMSTGIDTVEVKNPLETHKVIMDIINS